MRMRRVMKKKMMTQIISHPRMVTNLRNANKVEVFFWRKNSDEPIADESGVLIDVSFVTWPGKDCYLFRHTPLH